MSKAQEMGMSETEVVNLKDNVAKSGMIGASLGVAQGFIDQKQAQEKVRQETIDNGVGKAAAAPIKADGDGGNDRANAAYAARWAGIAAQAQAKAKDEMENKERAIAASVARWTGRATVEQAKEKEEEENKERSIAASTARWTGIAHMEQEKAKTNNSFANATAGGGGITSVWWAPNVIQEKAYEIFKALPSAGLINQRITTPIISIPFANLLSLGYVESQTASTDNNPRVRLNADGFSAGASMKNISIAAGVNTSNPSVSLNVRVASPVTFELGNESANVGYSAIAGVQLNNFYNATVSLDVNYVDLSIKNPNVVKGNARNGVYVEVNPWAAIIGVAIVVFTPWDELSLLAAGALAAAKSVIESLIPKGSPVPIP